MPDLKSISVGGITIKGDGQALVVQSHGSPSAILLNVDTANNVVTVNGTLTATAVGGAIGSGSNLVTIEIIDNTATVVGLDKDYTLYNSTSNVTVTIAPGTNGQIKYIASANTGQLTVNKLGGGILFPGSPRTGFKLTSGQSGITLIYNTTVPSWSILGVSNIDFLGGP